MPILILLVLDRKITQRDERRREKAGVYKMMFADECRLNPNLFCQQHLFNGFVETLAARSPSKL